MANATWRCVRRQADQMGQSLSGRSKISKVLVAMYLNHLRTNPDLINSARLELRGKDLACWCPLGQPCHADVLLEVANG